MNIYFDENICTYRAEGVMFLFREHERICFTRGCAVLVIAFSLWGKLDLIVRVLAETVDTVCCFRYGNACVRERERERERERVV